MNRTLLTVAVGAALLGAGGYGGYWYAQRAPHAAPAAAAPAAATSDAKTHNGRKVLYWHDPMYPQQKFDKPGRSPFMDMDLMPVYADEADDAGGVKVSPRVVQNLGVRTAVAEKGRLAVTVEAVGTVAFDERAVTVVQSRTPGYIEKLFVRAPLDPVRRGQPLAQLFVPEWAGAQEEYLALRRSTAPDAQDLARAARNRLLLLGMVEEQVAEVERRLADHQHQPTPFLQHDIASPLEQAAARAGRQRGNRRGRARANHHRVGCC